MKPGSLLQLKRYRKYYTPEGNSGVLKTRDMLDFDTYVLFLAEFADSYKVIYQDEIAFIFFDGTPKNEVFQVVTVNDQG